MRHLIFAALLFITISVRSQNTEIFPTESGRIFYSQTQKVDSSLTKDHLFTLTKMWLAFLFEDSREVILMEDREGGVIMVKGILENYLKSGVGTYKMSVSFRMSVKMKNGSYNLQVSDLEANYVVMNTLQRFIPDNSTPKRNAKNIYSWRKETHTTIEIIIMSLYKYIEKNKGDFISISSQ